MRRSYRVKQLMRHQSKPGELLLVSMIDIFTVLVTFLLMTAVFSRTVILQLKLSPAAAHFKAPPPGLQLEVVVRHDGLVVEDRNSGPLATFTNRNGAYDYDGLSQYLQLVKSKFPNMTAASVLLEPDTSYDTMVQVMDRVRVLQINAGLSEVRYQLFPDISIGDAPFAAAAVGMTRVTGNSAGTAGRAAAAAVRTGRRRAVTAGVRP